MNPICVCTISTPRIFPLLQTSCPSSAAAQEEVGKQETKDCGKALTRKEEEAAEKEDEEAKSRGSGSGSGRGGGGGGGGREGGGNFDHLPRREKTILEKN